MEGVKIAVIGGGSSYTPELASGIIARAESLPVREVALCDIPAGMEKAAVVGELLRRMFRAAGHPAAVTVTIDRRAALAGADFVIAQYRVGGLAARALDEAIPLAHGFIGQETTGPGGFMNALRTIPVALDLCREIEELAPEALLINFTNPSGIITEAISRHAKVRCIGLCNLPIIMTSAIAALLGARASELRCRFVGLNHLSFITSVAYRGRELLGELLARGDASLVELPVDFVRALGAIPSPYLKYYAFEGRMLREEREAAQSAAGTRAHQVMEIERRLFEAYADPRLDRKPEELAKRGGALYSEAAVSLIDSIWNDRADLHVVNVPNGSALPDLPADSVVETTCVVGRAGAAPLASGPLPERFRGLVQQVKGYERLTIEAALSGDREQALIALLNNPLVRDGDRAAAMLEELLAANAAYLPRFGGGA